MYPKIAIKNSCILMGFNNVTGDLTVNAQWAVRICTVVFKNGDAVLKTQAVEYGQAATAPSDPVMAGHTFAGWNQPFDKVISDLTVSALWSVSICTVVFKNGDAVLKTQEVEYGQAATAPSDPVKEGYHTPGAFPSTGASFSFTGGGGVFTTGS